MALQVWLPLNGTLENKGLANIKMTGTPAYSNGKIGKCVEFNATTTNIIHDSNVCPDLKYTDNFSFCLWVNNKRTSDDTAIQYVFTAGRADGTTYGYGIELKNPNFHIKFGSSSYNVTGTLNTWTHLAFTKQGTTIKIYKNGSLYSTNTFSGTLPEYTQYTGIGIGCFHYSSKNIYPSRCQVNDFRIYDHALSPKEVKEISKGLILHYKLDGNDIGITIPRNGDLIPDGVELYDYILSSGTLWIDTEANVSSTSRVVTKVRKLNTNTQHFFGARDADSAGAGYAAGIISNNFISDYQGRITLSAASAIANKDILIDKNGSSIKVTIGDTTTTYTNTAKTFTLNNSLYIFAMHMASGGSGEIHELRVYNFQLYNNNTLVRNMLPCTFLGEPGMWDTVENKFYRNQGTGTFTLGNKITLKEYEYLQSSGTQWINTGVNGYMNHKYVLDYQQTGTGSYRVWGVFGQSGFAGYNMSITYAGGRCVRWSSTSSGTNLVDNIDTITNTDRHIFIIDNGLVYYDGVNKGRSDGHSSSCVINYPLYLFTVNPANTTPSANSQVKVYSYKDYDSSNNLIRDMIPASYNGTPGLWDKVEWKFYANAGSGSFTLGPEKTVQQDAPVFYDSSGYCNHGSITGTLTTNSDSPRYTASTVFNGSSAINAGRGAMVRDAISVCCWAYMTSWSSYNARLISCTETGGWNFEPSSGKMLFLCGTGTSSNTYKPVVGTTALSALASGWHQFVGTYDGLSSKIYIDGVLNGTNAAYTTKTPLYYNSTNVIFVGAEATSSASTPNGSYFNGRLSDVRIYATALSEDDVKELYNTSAFVTNNGVFAEYELYEDNLSDVKKRGLLETANFYENGAESGYALDTDKTRVASNYIISEDFIEI